MTPEQEAQLDLYEKGRQLMLIVGSPAWDIILETLQGIADDATTELIGLAPGDPNVVAAHAAASACQQMNHSFRAGIQRAIEAGQQKPDFSEQDSVLTFF